MDHENESTAETEPRKEPAPFPYANLTDLINAHGLDATLTALARYCDETDTFYHDGKPIGDHLRGLIAPEPTQHRGIFG